MLAELEDRLATVLGNDLPAPFAGRVRVEGDPPSGAGPAVMVGVRHAAPLPADFGAIRHEPVPAPPERQRVVRLRCSIAITVEPKNANDREQVMDGIDALLYLLDSPEYLSARVLVDATDQGFRLSALTLDESWPGLRPEEDAPPHLTLRADGWFWQVGAEAEAGVQIVEVRVGQVTLPLTPDALPARIRAGGDPVELRFAADLTGTLRLRSDGPASDSFGQLAVQLLGEAGGPGAGSLSGGDDGPDGSRLLTVTDGVVTVTYTPPDDAAVDRVVVHVLQGGGETAALGLELARFTLAVEAGA